MEIVMDSKSLHSIRAKKSLGQHFLTSKEIAKRLVDAAHVQKGDVVVEVGPGTGILTEQLLAAGASVTAIEIDPLCIASLEEVFAQEIAAGQLTIISSDVRIFTPTVKNYKVVANIPYYITGEIIRLFLEQDVKPSCMVVLVQKEVAERIARSKKESILSLSVKAYGQPKYIKTVKAGSFFPKPSVDSAILAIYDISDSFFKDIGEDDFFLILHKAFGEKRKQVGKTLGPLIEREKLPISPTTRPEDIPLETWRELVLLMHKE